MFYSLLIPEDDFGKMLAKNIPGHTNDGTEAEGVEHILHALYGEKSFKEVSLIMILYRHIYMITIYLPMTLDSRLV